MASIARAAAAVAAILTREGIDYAQSKAVFKAARQRAGLRSPPERRGSVDRLTVEEELRFLDQAYAQSGRTGLMLQTLLETGARASELVQLRVEDVSLGERVITMRHGKGDKRREVPIRRELAQLLRLHIGGRRAGPLFVSRQQGSGPTPYMLTRQRVGQVVCGVARMAGITKRVYPHLLRHTVATRLLALGMDIADLQRFLGHESIATTRLYAETTAAALKRNFDRITDPAACSSRRVQPEGTSTRRHTIGLMPSNHTLTCTIAFASAADGAEGPRESGSLSRRFIQPDYRLPCRPSPGTPQILMLSYASCAPAMSVRASSCAARRTRSISP